MLEWHPVWVLSFYLGHIEIKEMHTEQFKRSTKRQQALTGNNTAPATPLDLAGLISEMDEAVLPDVAAQKSQIDLTAAKDNTGEQQEYSFCSHRHAKINRLEENRILNTELS